MIVAMNRARKAMHSKFFLLAYLVIMKVPATSSTLMSLLIYSVNVGGFSFSCLDYTGVLNATSISLYTGYAVYIVLMCSQLSIHA